MWNTTLGKSSMMKINQINTSIHIYGIVKEETQKKNVSITKCHKRWRESQSRVIRFLSENHL